MEEPAVVVLADDLIWSTRLADLVTALGRRPVVVRTVPDLLPALPVASAVIVDLTARAYDPISAIEIAAHDQERVLAVGQHDDAEQRKRALAAGAQKVVPYRLLFEKGDSTLAAWLGPVAVSPAATGGDA
jgi:hypothetical protein